MLPNRVYLHREQCFWAAVKKMSEHVGYSADNQLLTFNVDDIIPKIANMHIPTDIVHDVVDYMNYRAKLLNDIVKDLLMNKDEAKEIFENLVQNNSPSCTLPMNKQRGEKRHYAYFTCAINILTERNLQGKAFCDDPRKLATFYNSFLCYTMSRRVDGAYPDVENPIAIWEIKEYYDTTTFGSRVADGVYETQLDGHELIQAKKELQRKIHHYLLIDDYFTWWVKGKSYLCRLLDIMHMGLVDEILFGREILFRWPEIVNSWLPTK